MQISKKYKYHILYRTVNLINNKFYIGVHSSNEEKDNYLGSGGALKKAIKKYGKVNFYRENLFICDTREELKELEELVIDSFLINNSNCYNLTKGGELPPIMFGEDNPMFGKPKSSETKDKISKSLVYYYKKNGTNTPNKGKKLSKEWKDNIGKSLEGKKRTKASKEASRCVQHIETGVFFSSLKEGCEVMEINLSTERGRAWRGKSNFIFI